MKYKYIIGIMVLAVMLILNSCKKEAALTPSGASDVYTLPQGNNAFDQTIVGYFNLYSTYILYQYNQRDIYWTPTGYTIPTEFNGYWSSGHEVKEADPTFINKQLALIKSSLFDLYNQKFLKKFLPTKILLCSEIDSIGTGYDQFYNSFKVDKSIGAYSYYNTICVSYGSAAIDTMTVADKAAFVKKINTMFIKNISDRGLSLPNSDFTASADYSTAMTDYVASYGRGILTPYYSANAKDDWNLYLQAMVTLSETQLNLEVPMPGQYDYPGPTLLGILNAQKDINGQIRKRYTLVRNYFISEYGVDLQAIGNAANP